MAKGTIKMVKHREGYGFINQDGNDEDVYFKTQWVKDVSVDEIRRGLRVEYETQRTPQGLQTKWVRAIAEQEQVPTEAQQEGYHFLNPYNFVRILDEPKDANTPEKRLLLRCPPPPHDRYVGLTGRITCKVDAITPLFVSDSHAVFEGDNGHKTYRFFQVDGQPALPASSLRGMFRSVFEAATNSCLVIFDGKPQLPYRDVSAARWMKPGIVKALATGNTPGRITLCKEAAVRAYQGGKKPIVLDSSWQTGEGAFAIVKRPNKGSPFVAELGRTRGQLSQPKRAVEGWLKITGPNIETKLSERFFYQPETDESRWVEFNLDRQQDYNEILSQQFKEPGFSSTHQHTTLTPGDLVYVEMEEDGRTVRNIAATKVPRLRYRTAIGDLLGENFRLLHRCKDPDALCPACRVFGWVWDSPPQDADQVAYAGRVRLLHGKIEGKWGTEDDIILAILSTPKPTTTPFYLLGSDGQPDATVNYDTPGAHLRGRKFYRHHGEMLSEQEYRRAGDNKDDQNRTVHGALKPGATFTFTLDFENLAPLELGALLYALELEDGMFHRLGYAKPLGFGSVKVTVESVQTIDWETRLQSVESNAGWQSIDGVQYKQEFLETMQTLYGDGFAEVLADLRALLGTPPESPIHYPRPTRQFDPDHPQFEWFVGNKRRIEKRQDNAVSLPLASADTQGLPLIEKDGKEGRG